MGASFLNKLLLQLLTLFTIAAPLSVDAAQLNKNKILVLIVASDDQPVYLELQKNMACLHAS